MVSICPVCKKEFEILHPQMWRYKINSEYVCSWGCLRKGETKGVEQVKREIPQEAKLEAVRIAIEGGDPIEYLGKYSVNPAGMWTYIRSVVKKTDPETFAKIPNLREKPPKKALQVEKPKKPKPEKPRTVKKAEIVASVNTQQPEGDAMDMEIVANADGIWMGKKQQEPDVQILRLASRKTGIEYYLSDDRNRMVMESGGDLFNMSIEQLPDFLQELPPICRQLGVKV